jgi:hypothetical protein
MLGQGHGFIRLTDGRKVFFHRSDLPDGASFSDFAVGDADVIRSVVREHCTSSGGGPGADNAYTDCSAFLSPRPSWPSPHQSFFA